MERHGRAGDGACVSSPLSPSHPVSFPPLSALLMLEENICSMSSFPPGRCLAASPWKMALCQYSVGARWRGWSWGSMLVPHGGLGPVARGSSPLYPSTGRLCRPLALVGGLSPILGHLPAPLPGRGSVARLCLGRGKQFSGWASTGGRVSRGRGGGKTSEQHGETEGLGV